MRGIVKATLCAAEGSFSAQDVVRSELMASYALYERLARSRTKNPSDAADIVQSFALKALHRAGQLRDPRAVRGWLRRIFETSIIDHFRSRTRTRQREVALEGQGAALDDAIAPPGLVNETQLIKATMACLKSEYAEIICRVDLQDQTTEQIAADLGITVNNMAVRHHRARTAFRDALDRRLLPRAADNRRPRRSDHAKALCHFCAGRHPSGLREVRVPMLQ